jgi:hypothetical protein
MDRTSDTLNCVFHKLKQKSSKTLRQQLEVLLCGAFGLCFMKDFNCRYRGPLMPTITTTYPRTANSRPTPKTDEVVAPLALRDFLMARGWKVVEAGLKYRQFVLDNPEYPRRQLSFPMDTTAHDYSEAVDQVREKLAEITGEADSDLKLDIARRRRDFSSAVFNELDGTMDAGEVPFVAAAADLAALSWQHFNEPILVHGELGRLVGYREDQMDCYLIVSFPRKAKVTYCTCVGGYTFLDSLKSQREVVAHNGEIWNSFTRLDSDLASLGVQKADRFTFETNSDDEVFDFGPLLAAALEEGRGEANAKEVLAEVMSWIDNWDPNFTHDAEWGETEAKARRVLEA